MAWTRRAFSSVRIAPKVRGRRGGAGLRGGRRSFSADGAWERRDGPERGEACVNEEAGAGSARGRQGDRTGTGPLDRSASVRDGPDDPASTGAHLIWPSRRSVVARWPRYSSSRNGFQHSGSLEAVAWAEGGAGTLAFPARPLRRGDAGAAPPPWPPRQSVARRAEHAIGDPSLVHGPPAAAASGRHPLLSIRPTPPAQRRSPLAGRSAARARVRRPTPALRGRARGRPHEGRFAPPLPLAGEGQGGARRGKRGHRRPPSSPPCQGEGQTGQPVRVGPARRRSGGHDAARERGVSGASPPWRGAGCRSCAAVGSSSTISASGSGPARR